MTKWIELAGVLERKAGLVDRRDLDELGVSKMQLQRWVAQRRLERIAPRVWSVVGAEPTWRRRLHVGLASLGRMAWVSHEAAAQLHGFDRTPTDRVEFLVLHSERSTALNEEVHTTRRWGPIDEVEIDGLRVTSATRTIHDLANASAHPDRLSAAIDSAVRLELSSPEAIRQRLQALRGKGRNGVRRIEQLLVNSGGHTMLERKFLELMDLAGLPRPETQVVFRTEETGQFVARVDFYYPEFGIVVEVSGKIGHSSPFERARDAQRRNELQELGQRVFEFTWEDVTQRAAMVITQMRKLLRTPA